MQQRTPNADRVARLASAWLGSSLRQTAPDNEFLVCVHFAAAYLALALALAPMFAVIANFRV